MAPSIYSKQENSSLFQSDKRATDYQISDSRVALDLGYTFNEFSEGRLGFQSGYQDIHVKVGEPLEADYDGEIRIVTLKWSFSSADNPFLPRRGLMIRSHADWYLNAPDSSNEFGLIENKIRWNISVG